jgi:hypothetical protein
MNRRRVGEDRGSKETDGCPLTNTGRVGEERGGKEMDGCPLIGLSVPDLAILS